MDTTKLEKVFVDNLKVKTTEYGIYVETYGIIDTPTRMGTCHYAQAYPKGTTRMEAVKRFIDFYVPMNYQDNQVNH